MSSNDCSNNAFGRSDSWVNTIREIPSNILSWFCLQQTLSDCELGFLWQLLFLALVIKSPQGINEMYHIVTAGKNKQFIRMELKVKWQRQNILSIHKSFIKHQTRDSTIKFKGQKLQKYILNTGVRVIIWNIPYFFYIFDHAKYSITLYFFQNNYFLCF